MPGRDGTGPRGIGSMTGRGLGFCTGANFLKYGAGLGLGLGLAWRRAYGRRGLGRGRGFAVDSAVTSSKTQKELLREQKDILQSQLAAIEEQLGDQ